MTGAGQFLTILESHPPGNIAINDTMGQTLDYASLTRCIREQSEWLDEFEPGGVAVALDNGPAAIVCDIALMLSCHWCLPVPPFFTSGQTMHAMADSGCRYMLANGHCAGELIGTRIVAEQALHLYELPHSAPIELPIGTKKITYTSGSTGNPKGLCLSERHMLDRVDAVVKCLDFAPPFRHLSLLPWAVLLENVAGIYACLQIGATCIAPPLSRCASEAMRYDFDTVSQLANTHMPDSTILVPELLRQYLGHLQSQPQDTGHWQFIAVGGATVAQGLHQQSHELGLPVYEGYGLSEAASVVSLNAPSVVSAGSVGKLLPGVSISIAEDGELLLDKPSFLGVTGSLESPPQPYPTGDIGSLSCHGYLSVAGRKKTIIVTGMGRNVAPEWIESELVGMPGIRQAFVYANARDQLAMLVVCAGTVEKLDSDVNTAMLQLPDYAKIQNWFVVDEFSVENGLLTGNGKLHRGNLASLASQLEDQYVESHVNHSCC